MGNNVSISFPANAEHICIARYAAGVIANSMGFDIEKIEDIKLVVGEACNNATLHANTEENIIHLNMNNIDDSLIIEVRDQGNGFNLDEYKEPKIGKVEHGGFGIYIMKSLADELRFIQNEDDSGVFLYIKFILH